jgi:hypothetical protein
MARKGSFFAKPHARGAKETKETRGLLGRPKNSQWSLVHRRSNVMVKKRGGVFVGSNSLKGSARDPGRSMPKATADLRTPRTEGLEETDLFSPVSTRRRGTPPHSPPGT